MIAQDKGFYERSRTQRRDRPRQGLGQHRAARRQQGDAVRLRGRFCRRQQRVEGNEHQDGRRHLPAQSDRGRGARRIRTSRLRRIWRARPLPYPTGATQFQQWPAFVKGCGLDGGKIRVANIDPAGSPPALITGQVRRHRRLCARLCAERRDPRQQEGAHPLVRRLRRHRGEQRHHRACRPRQGGSRAHSRASSPRA